MDDNNPPLGDESMMDSEDSVEAIEDDDEMAAILQIGHDLLFGDDEDEDELETYIY